MSATNLTTKDVARLLHVSEATVKRWADDGRLLPEKTVGGHRRFSLHSVAQLRREQGVAPTADSHTARKRSGRHQALSLESFTDLLLSAEETEVGAQLIDAYLQGQEPALLFDTTVTEAMHRVGDLWFNGTITVADEHLATRVMLSALQRLRGIIVLGQPTGLKAICCGIEGDLHELPIHLAEILIEIEGWNTTNLGPNTPLFALREMVAQKKPQLVCISARSIADLDRATAEYAQLRKMSEKINGAIVLGGEAFKDRKLRERFPADYYPQSFQELAKFVRKLSKRA